MTDWGAAIKHSERMEQALHLFLLKNLDGLLEDGMTRRYHHRVKALIGKELMMKTIRNPLLNDEIGKHGKAACRWKERKYYVMMDNLPRLM